VAEVPLEKPRSVADLYMAVGDDVSPARPVLPGDVFEAVDIGLDHDGFVLLVAHPCSMRRGAGQLRPRIAAAPIRNHGNPPLEAWPERDFNWFPLPEVFEVGRAASFLELGSARSEDLLRERRIVSLSEYGIYVLQQRFVHSLTRVVVGLDRLGEASAHVLAECELEEE
jgi:hypothetical protein